MTDEQILQAYREYDEKFRQLKKKGRYAEANQYKAKRDALDAEVARIHKERANKK